MNKHNSSHRIICGLVLTGLLIFSLPAFAQNKVLIVPASEFVPGNETTSYSRGLASLYANASSSLFWAPINLPADSKVKKLVLVCKDDGAGGVLISLGRKKMDTLSWPVLLFSSSGADPDTRTFSKPVVFTIKPGVVYGLYLIMPNGSKYVLHHVRIVYEPAP